MERFLRVFSADKIDYLTGDREFIGGYWIAYLQYKLIKFVIRIREDAKITNSKGREKHACVFRVLINTDSASSLTAIPFFG